MTLAQHAEMQRIFQYFETVPLEKIEEAFENQWKNYILSLDTEDDRALAFKLFYEWQIARSKALLSTAQDAKASIAA